MKRIKSGVYGLNPLMNGGIREKSLTVVIGSAGAGKTTLAMQFIRRGLEDGVDGIYITLDEPPYQLIAEAREMGWLEIDDYIEDELLVFIDASGREFTKFVKEELADIAEEWKGASARIVIDPLTPVIWALKDPADQRDLISFLFRETKAIGTVICTLEEHGTLGTLSGPETIIPMYLADNVIHMRYVSTNDLFNREIKVIKSRASGHSERYHPYEIIPGAGVVISQIEEEESGGDRLEIKELFKQIYQALPKEKKAAVGKSTWKKILKIIERANGHRVSFVRAEEFIRLVLVEYGVISPDEKLPDVGVKNE